MHFVKFRKENLFPFLEAVSSFPDTELAAPVKKGIKSYSYDYITRKNFGNISVSSLRTILPIKKFFLKPIEVMFEESKNENGRGGKTSGGPVADYNDIKEPEYFCGIKRDLVIFGPHQCDINGKLILDEVFGRNYRDPYYFGDSCNVRIIGMNCMPDDKCFCKSMGTDSAVTGFDLFLTDIGDYYFVSADTYYGEKLIEKINSLYSAEGASLPFFENIGSRDRSKYLEFIEKKDRSFTLEMNAKELPFMLEIKKDSDFWDELGRRCLLCGNCTNVCPTCQCFNIFDRVSFGEGKANKRLRTYDSCFYKDHARTADFNFRKERKDRVKNRYFHKHNGFYHMYGKSSCVGCGRCIESCPTGINIVKVFADLWEYGIA